MIFEKATTALIVRMGFRAYSGYNRRLHVGGQSRFGVVDTYAWVGLGVTLEPVGAFRDWRRAERLARRIERDYRDGTGRVFIVGSACREARPVFLVLAERYDGD